MYLVVIIHNFQFGLGLTCSRGDFFRRKEKKRKEKRREEKRGFKNLFHLTTLADQRLPSSTRTFSPCVKLPWT
jgi:hypothetical protein